MGRKKLYSPYLAAYFCIRPQMAQLGFLATIFSYHLMLQPGIQLKAAELQLLEGPFKDAQLTELHGPSWGNIQKWVFFTKIWSRLFPASGPVHPRPNIVKPQQENVNSWSMSQALMTSSKHSWLPAKNRRVFQVFPFQAKVSPSFLQRFLYERGHNEPQASS